VGSQSAVEVQNAFVFYDRNDQVFMDNVDVRGLHGRALYSGVSKVTRQAYMRESHLRSLRFFDDGAPGIPVVEFSSQGAGDTDATNEIRISQLDIYGARGPGLVIRNGGDGTIRDITINDLRIEGSEMAAVSADLATIGDRSMKGGISNVFLRGVELIDPYPGFAALRVTAPSNGAAPYHIVVDGFIGGGKSRGQGLRIDAGHDSIFRLSSIHTDGTNVVIGPGVSNIELDGGGEERTWTYQIDQSSKGGVRTPAVTTLNTN